MARLTNHWTARGSIAGITTIAIMVANLVGCDRQPESDQGAAVSVAGSQASPSKTPPASANPATSSTPPPTLPTPARPATGVAAPPTAPASSNLPPVVFLPAVLDLGTVLPGVKTTSTVQIQNTGTKPLKVMKAGPSCTCTTIKLTKSIIAVGESIPLEVVYSSTSGLGHKNAAVRMVFDGYDMIELAIRANIELSVHAEPWYLDATLKDDKGKEIISGEYSVISSDSQPFRILAVNGGAVPFIDFDPAHDQPRSSYRVRWDLSSYANDTCRNAAGEHMPGWVVVETDHPGCPIFDLEVRHECVRRKIVDQTWSTQEKRVLLGAVKPGEPAEVEVTVKYLPSRSRGDVIKYVSSESKQFAVELVEVKNVGGGLVCRIRITPAADQKGLIYGNLRLSSDKQSDPVTVIGVVR